MKPKNKQIADKWEDEFDSKFVDWNSPRNITEYHGTERTVDAIKTFISDLLYLEREMIIEMLEGMKDITPANFPYMVTTRTSRELEILEEAIEKIKKL